MKKRNGARLQKMTVRTTAGLCEALFDEFDMLRNGESDATRVTAVAKMATTIVSTKRLEIDAAQLIKDGLRMRPVLLESNRRLTVIR